jgi:hypothetical protein
VKASIVLCVLLAACAPKPVFEPKSPATVYHNPTILVTNTMCPVDSCPVFHVYAPLPTVCVVPGLDPCVPPYLLGPVDTSQACLLLPDSSGITGDTITLVAVYPGESYATSPFVTRPFVPQEAPGWSVAFPGSNVSPPSLAPMNNGCTPATAASFTSR